MANFFEDIVQHISGRYVRGARVTMLVITSTTMTSSGMFMQNLTKIRVFKNYLRGTDT